MVNFERSPRAFQAECQKSVKYSMPKMKKIRLKTKKWIGAMFWQNWLDEKIG
jgi:hypothetical protein